jgi:predicted DNA-binding mobile mystery protein A
MGTAVNRRHIARRSLDRRLDHWRELGSATTRPRGGWVRAIREALGMSAADLGRLMHVTDTSVLRLEQSEQGNRARLDTLQRAADALGCDLVYALVPRRPLEQIVAGRARDVARDELARVDHTMTLEAQRVDDSHWQERIESYAIEVAEQPGLWRDRS